MGTLLSSADRDRIAAKIAEVELATAGELVVHVTQRSSGYGFVRALYAASGAYVVAQVAVLTEPFAGSDFYFADWALPSLPVLAGVLWLLLGVPALLRRVLPSSVVDLAVLRRAETAFLENRVHRTVAASGVLILVSELEHRVQILADEGIHQRVGVEGWTKHVAQIVEQIRVGRTVEGLLTAIDAIGRELAEAFPPSPEDENELPNAVVDTKR